MSNNLHITYNCLNSSNYNTAHLIIINNKDIIYNVSSFNNLLFSTENKCYLYNLKDNIYNALYISYNYYNMDYMFKQYFGSINFLSKLGGLSTLKGSIKSDSICINSTGKYDNEVVNIEYIKKLVYKLCHINGLTNPFHYT